MWLVFHCIHAYLIGYWEKWRTLLLFYTNGSGCAETHFRTIAWDLQDSLWYCLVLCVCENGAVEVNPSSLATYPMCITYTVEPLYNGHHWDQRFCPLYRGVLCSGGDCWPLTIMVTYAGARLWTMKSVVLMKDPLIFLALRQESRTLMGFMCNCRSLIIIPMLVVGVAKCPLCEVICYCNGTEISVHCME